MQSHNHTITTERAADKSGQQSLTGIRCVVLDEDGGVAYDSQGAHGDAGVFADAGEATEHGGRWLAAMAAKLEAIEHTRAARGVVLGGFLTAVRLVEEGHKFEAKTANAAAKAAAARRELAERDQAQPRVSLDYEPDRGDWRLTIAPSELDAPLEQPVDADAIEGLDELDDELAAAGERRRRLADAMGEMVPAGVSVRVATTVCNGVHSSPGIYASADQAICQANARQYAAAQGVVGGVVVKRKAPPKPVDRAAERATEAEEPDDGPRRPVAERLVDALARAKVSDVIARLDAVRPSPETVLALHQAELVRTGKPRSKLLDRLLEEPASANEPDPWAALLLCSRLHPREDLVEAALPQVRDVAVVRWLSSWELSRGKKHSRASVVGALEERLGQLLELEGGAA